MVMRTGNQAAPAPGAGGSPRDDYLHMPRPKGMSTTGTNASGALNKSSTVADYMKARGAAPVDGLAASKPKGKRGAPPTAQPGTPPGRKPPVRGGPQMRTGATPAPVAPPAPTPPTIAPGGSMAQAGNPSTQRANAFNVQRLAGPARPQPNNGLAPPTNPGTIQPAGGNAGPGRPAPLPPMRAPPTDMPAPQQANAPGAGALTKAPASNVQPKPTAMGGGGGSAAGPQPMQQSGGAPAVRPRIA